MNFCYLMLVYIKLFLTVYLKKCFSLTMDSPPGSTCSSLQDNGLVPIVEPEILLDGDHSIERTLEVAEKVWSEVFFYLAQNNVLFEGILLKPSMVTPGAEHKEKASPETIAKYTLTMLRRRVPPAVPGIMVQQPVLLYFLFT